MSNVTFFNLTEGTKGKSAYEVAVDNGFWGTEQQWLSSLKGKDGKDGASGESGLDGNNGADGKSAYELAVDNGFLGTEQDWLDSLKLDSDEYYTRQETDDAISTTIAGMEISHDKLVDRDLDEQHPMTAISGLVLTLQDFNRKIDAVSGSDTSQLATKDDINTFNNQLTEKINEHTENNDIHVTDEQKKYWNGKQDDLGFEPENPINKGAVNGYAPLDITKKVPLENLPDNLTDTYTKTEVDSKFNYVAQNINQEATLREQGDSSLTKKINDHSVNAVVHVTQVDKDTWNSKIEQTDLAVYDSHINNGDIHVSATDKVRWDGNVSAYVVNNETEMLAITSSSLKVGDVCYIRSVEGKYLKYIWYGQTDSWKPDTTTAEIINMTWANISNKPTSSVANIDSAVSKSHEHSNLIYLNKISQDNNGNLTYNGLPAIAPVLFYKTNAMLPTTGEGDKLYVVYKDNRVNNFASISMWIDGAFELIGRSDANSSVSIGDFSLRQITKFDVTANSFFTFEISPNYDYMYTDINVLKLVEGSSNQNKVYSSFLVADGTKFQYDEKFLYFSTGLKIKSTVSFKSDFVSSDSTYNYSYKEIDLNNWISISEVS